MAIYSIPDIHGNLKGLEQAVNKVMETFNKKEDTLVFLGDYIDRGENSLGVIQYLMSLQEQYGKETIICLMGNHDDMFNNWINNPTSISFLHNDFNLATIKSFVKDYFGLSKLVFYNMGIYDEYSWEEKTFNVHSYIKSQYQKEIEWLRNLPLYYDAIESQNTLYIHAGIEENMLGGSWKDFTSEKEMIWKFPPSYGENPYGFNIVAGHCMVHKDFWKFTEEDCFDIYITGNHYYTDGGSPFNKTLNILKLDKGIFYDILKDSKIN